jgi:hypothetical protein
MASWGQLVIESRQALVVADERARAAGEALDAVASTEEMQAGVRGVMALLRAQHLALAEYRALLLRMPEGVPAELAAMQQQHLGAAEGMVARVEVTGARMWVLMRALTAQAVAAARREQGRSGGRSENQTA